MCSEGEPFEFVVKTTPTARREHSCDECRRTIRPGERYERLIGKYDGYFTTYKACAHCQAARCWLDEACEGNFTIGDLLDQLLEHWEEDWLYRSVGLGRLILAVRARWHDGTDPVPDSTAVRALVPSAA